MRQEDIVKCHCMEEAKKLNTDVCIEYMRRLNDAIHMSVIEPYCKPYGTDIRNIEPLWIDNNRVVLKKGFNFYHHSQRELLNYSVKARGKWKTHLVSMEELYLNEYPAPNQYGVAYMVSTNGQHRRLVYHCIGIPVIKAHVQKAEENVWQYYLSENKKIPIKFLIWFYEIGLIDSLELLSLNSVKFHCRDNIAAWILPAPSCSVFGMIKEMKERLMLIENAFSPIYHDSFTILHSRFKWLISMEKACINRKVKVAINKRRRK